MLRIIIFIESVVGGSSRSLSMSSSWWLRSRILSTANRKALRRAKYQPRNLPSPVSHITSINKCYNWKEPRKYVCTANNKILVSKKSKIQILIRTYWVQKRTDRARWRTICDHTRTYTWKLNALFRSLPGEV